MTPFARIVDGFVLLAHGLVHLLYLVPAPAAPPFPFSLARSWLPPEPARRPVALALMTVVVLGFVAVALVVPRGWTPSRPGRPVVWWGSGGEELDSPSRGIEGAR